MKDRAKGILLMLLGVLCVSPDAVLVRFLREGGTNEWTIVFWKLLFSVPVSATYAVYEAGGPGKLGRSIMAGRWYYVIAIPVQAAVDISFTMSFVFTSAANALLLINLNPLWCAVLGRLFLGDTLPRRTWTALFLALCCMLIIFVPDVVERKKDGGVIASADLGGTSVKGNMISFFCGIGLAAYITLVRKGKKSSKNVNLIGAAALGAALSSVVSILVRRGDVLPTSHWRGEGGELWQFWLSFLAQGFGVGAVFVALTVAPKLITGAEIGLTLLLEVVLGPLWVFLAYGDAPRVWTLVGGSLLLVVLALHESLPLFKKAHRKIQRMSTRVSTSRNVATSPGASGESGVKGIDVEAVEEDASPASNKKEIICDDASSTHWDEEEDA